MITHPLPQTLQIRSGDLGEIYATEWVVCSGYRVPIKPLRWKDHCDTTPAPAKDESQSCLDPHARALLKARTGFDKIGGSASL